LVTKDRDFGQSIVYTKEELDKYGFNDSILDKIIKGIETGNIPIGRDEVSIKKVLSLNK
jgi:hypothetical protein